jgi:hypothetical protein
LFKFFGSFLSYARRVISLIYESYPANMIDPYRKRLRP